MSVSCYSEYHSSPMFQSRGVRFQQPSDPTPLAHYIDSDRSRMSFDISQPNLSSIDRFPNCSQATPSPGRGTLPGSAGYPSALRLGSSAPTIDIHSDSQNSSAPSIDAIFPFPTSSIDSGGHFASSNYASGVEEQSQACPSIAVLRERLVYCEAITDVLRCDVDVLCLTVNLLVDRLLGRNNVSSPEFKDSFASVGAPDRTKVLNPNVHPDPIAPNQQRSDEITQISQRFSALTSSIGQLLALQHRPTAANDNKGPLPSMEPAIVDISPNQFTCRGPMEGSLSYGLQNRPDMRPARNPKQARRTSSVDIPRWVSGGGTRTFGRPDFIVRDMHRSIPNFTRRDSAGEDISSTALVKWDQLPLAPKLQELLAKFGVGPSSKVQRRALPFLLNGSDVIAQAPPTQERMAAYVIPAVHVAFINSQFRPSCEGPYVVIVSATVDQATQAQRMVHNIGGHIGVQSALALGEINADALVEEIKMLRQNNPHILCGTPQKLHALFTAPSGLIRSQVRFLILDEVDQLITRNLRELVFNIIEVLPAPHTSPTSTDVSTAVPAQIGRQTALFSNTVPQDVLNLATTIRLRKPARVLVRRDGNITNVDTLQGPLGLHQFYLYLAITTSGSRSDATPPSELARVGVIGSGRSTSIMETVQAQGQKLDALRNLFDTVNAPQAIVHVGGMFTLNSVLYNLTNHGLEVIPLTGDMNAGARLVAINKFRNHPISLIGRTKTKVLVVYNMPDITPLGVSQVRFLVNYDLPNTVGEYSRRVAPAVASGNLRPGVVINFVLATGGDIEMLRSIECSYRMVCHEVPTDLRGFV